MKDGKVWGETFLLLRTPLVEVHRLLILPNARCSNHLHRYKHNGFIVVTGRLYIEVQKSDYALVDVTELGPGELTTVRPNEMHRFLTKDEGCHAIEFYYMEPLSTDIVRTDVGGLIDPQ